MKHKKYFLMKIRPILPVLIIAASLTSLSCSSTIADELVDSPAKTYYVSPNGNDSNEGISVDSPWKSLAKLGEVEFQPGDSILFSKGSEYHGGIKFKSSGTAGMPIVLSSYGTGSNPSFTNSDYDHLNGNVFQISGKYVTIDGLSFKHCANSGSTVNREIL